MRRAEARLSWPGQGSSANVAMRAGASTYYKVQLVAETDERGGERRSWFSYTHSPSDAPVLPRKLLTLTP